LPRSGSPRPSQPSPSPETRRSDDAADRRRTERTDKDANAADVTARDVRDTPRPERENGTSRAGDRNATTDRPDAAENPDAKDLTDAQAGDAEALQAGGASEGASAGAEGAPETEVATSGETTIDSDGTQTVTDTAPAVTQPVATIAAQAHPGDAAATMNAETTGDVVNMPGALPVLALAGRATDADPFKAASGDGAEKASESAAGMPASPLTALQATMQGATPETAKAGAGSGATAPASPAGSFAAIMSEMVGEVASSEAQPAGRGETSALPQAGALLQTGQGPATPEAPRAPVTVQAPLALVPIEIGLKAAAGLNRFEIRLDPEELGRIDVRLDLGDDGSVSAKLVVDRVETLALLQRDARTLERAFEQIGLKTSGEGIAMTLRDPGSEHRERQDQASSQTGRAAPERPGETNMNSQASQPESATLQRWWRPGGVDMRI
jgi:flagellar hook-length control protein FliK